MIYHTRQPTMFDAFDGAPPIRSKPAREGFVLCSPCNGSGRLFNPTRICRDCQGLGQKLAKGTRNA